MKTTNNDHRKRLSRFLKTLTVATLLGMGFTASAQSGTCTVLQQPCNHDGQLSVTMTGMIPPLDYYYYEEGGNTVSHMNVNSLTDMLTGISSPVVEIFVQMSGGGGSYYDFSSTGMVAPFTVDPPIVTDAICPSLTGTAQITINGGATPASVQWYTASVSGPGSYVGAGSTITLPAGNYSPVVTDASGCVLETGDSASYVNIRNISGINFSLATTVAGCTNGMAAINSLTGGIAPYTYLWSNGATTSSITGLTQGSYSVTVTDAQGCSASGSAYVNQSIVINANPVITPATCLQPNGSITSFGSGGTPPYTYAYSNGVTTQSVTGLSEGTFISVTVTDHFGCTGTTDMSIVSTTPITATYTATPSSCTAATGSATLSIGGGTAPYSVIWNTAPGSSGTTISGVPADNYHFIITDAVGCIREGFARIPSASTITASIYGVSPVCPATTTPVGVTATSSSPPLSYLWNTGATTASFTGNANTLYTCTITDNAGCTKTENVSIGQVSPIHVGFSTTPASCRYSADGSILANPVGGTAPYTYLWSNGQTTATATGLTPGSHGLTVHDAAGCTSMPAYTALTYNPLNDFCYCTISGKVYNDANGNCTPDAGEQGIQHIIIHCYPFGYAFTDANGNYSFQVPSGSYTISEVVQTFYPLSACQLNAIPVSVTAASGCTNTVNFANSITTVHDIHIIESSLIPAVTGNIWARELIVQNDGTVAEPSISLSEQTDGQVSPFDFGSAVTYTQPNDITYPNWYTADGLPLPAGGSTVIHFDYYITAGIPLGTAVTFSDSAAYTAPIANWLNDYTPWNNVSTYGTAIVGSYDPNFKEVSPKGTGAEGFISTNDSVLDYVIHFQNTGSYYAEKVVVKDTLDSDLDWTSLKLGYADYPYTATLSEDGILEFTFDHINLPWQAQTEMGSRALVAYSIKQKPHLAPGTQIKNAAAIYFDYNAPVMTNQTLNTIAAATGIAETHTDSNLNVYPNPANDVLTVDLGTQDNVELITIYDLQGRKIQSEKALKNAAVQHVAINNLVKGFYFIELQKNNGQKVTARFIKD